MRILLSPDGEGQGTGGQAAAGAGQQAAAGQSQQSTAQRIFGGAGQQAAQTGGASGEAGQSPTGEENQPAEAGGQQAAGGGAGQASPPAAGLTIEQVKLLAQELRGGQQQTQQQQPQMTQEEFDRLFKVFKPSPALWQALRGEDEAAAMEALGNLVQGGVQQSTALMTFHMMQEINRIQQMVQPALKFAEAQQLEQMKTEFFQAYPNLQGLEPLLVSIRDSMIKNGRQFQTKEEAFKAVADEAETILKKIPGYNGGQQKQQAGGQRAASGTQRQMPTLSGKGQGGAGAGAAAAPKSTAEFIFGPRRK